MEYSAEIKVSIQTSGPVNEPFDEPRMKIIQAKRHLHRLRELEVEHFASDWYDYDFKPTSEESKASLNVHVKLPGAEFGAVSGDVIHNCRAALDIMASLLVRLNGGNDKNVYFPFGSNEEEFEKNIMKKGFNRASLEAVRLLRSFRPYRGGNHILRGLHDLDIYDKHRAIIPNGANITTPEAKVEVVGGKAIITHVVYTKPTMKLTFPIGTPLEKSEVIPTLEQMINLVDQMIKRFESISTD